MDTLFDHPWQLIRVDRRDDIVEVAMIRTHARNALNGALMEELTEVARLLRLRTDVRAVILTGTDSYFSAGADLSGRGGDGARAGLLDNRRAVMIGAGADAWAASRQMDAAIVSAMRNGRSMSIEAVAATGGGFADTYALRGAATAIDAAALGCARVR